MTLAGPGRGEGPTDTPPHSPWVYEGPLLGVQDPEARALAGLGTHVVGISEDPAPRGCPCAGLRGLRAAACRDGQGVHPACSLWQRRPEDPDLTRPDPTGPDLTRATPRSRAREGAGRGMLPGGFGGSGFLRMCCTLLSHLCLTLCDPLDCSPPGSSVHRTLQAGTWRRSHIEATFHMDEISL